MCLSLTSKGTNMFYRTTVKKLLDTIIEARKELGEDAYITIHCTSNLAPKILQTYKKISSPFVSEQDNIRKISGMVAGCLLYSDIKKKTFGEVTVVGYLCETIRWKLNGWHPEKVIDKTEIVLPGHRGVPFKHVGTRTGRFRCDKPNISTPLKSEDIKSIFVKRETSEIVHRDSRDMFETFPHDHGELRGNHPAIIKFNIKLNSGETIKAHCLGTTFRGFLNNNELTFFYRCIPDDYNFITKDLQYNYGDDGSDIIRKLTYNSTIAITHTEVSKFKCHKLILAERPEVTYKDVDKIEIEITPRRARGL